MQYESENSCYKEKSVNPHLLLQHKCLEIHHLMTEIASFFSSVNRWIQNSLAIRLLISGFLVLILLIPISWVKDLIRERQGRQQEVIRELGAKWGESQTVSGPYLTIPYYKDVSYHTGDEEDKVRVVSERRLAYFLPETLDIDGLVKEEIRHRSLFKVVLYNAEMDLAGTFKRPDFSEWKIDPDKIKWDEASLSLGLSDLRSVQKQINIQWGKNAYPLNPGLPSKDVLQTGISTRVEISEEEEIAFTVDLDFNGSSELYFVPMGKVTNVKLASKWPDPSFVGAFLPDRDEDMEKLDYSKGFAEKWNVLHLNRPYPQQFRGKVAGINASAFGVKLLLPNEHYGKSMRSAKYAILLIGLTFMVFFFVQILNRIRLHPFHYLLVGLALTVFYSLLLSISEHLGFALGYSISAVAVVLLVSLYSLAIFNSKRHAGILGLILVMLYTFIFIILESQDYALLIGSIGLFLTLALAMYLSRNIDWSNPVGEKESPEKLI